MESAHGAVELAQSIPQDMTDTQQARSVLFSMWDGAQGLITLGGPVVALLMVLSMFALAIILIKLWQLTMMGRDRRRIESAVHQWLAGDYRNALDIMNRTKGVFSSVVARAMTGTAEGRQERYVREDTEHEAVRALSSASSYLRALQAVAQVAPLLGLFGTVLGMIEAFRSLEAAGTQVNPADLAGGIWVALMTTAVGLAVAMPVSLVLYALESRIDRMRVRLEGWVTAVLTHPAAPHVTVAPAESQREKPVLAEQIDAA